MITDKDASATDSPRTSAAAAASARYNASLAAKASPIPKAGNYAKPSGGTTSGYSYVNTSPLKPISSIPAPPYPIMGNAKEHVALPATPDDAGEVEPSQIPDLTAGVGWNSAKKRAMAKKRREVMERALRGRTTDDDDEDDSSEEEEESVVDAAQSEGEVEVIESYEPVPKRQKERSDDFDSDGIAWGQVDVDAIEATASQQARTPRISRTVPAAALEGPRSSGRGTFMDRLEAVNRFDTTEYRGPTPKKRKREDQGDDNVSPQHPPSSSTVTHGGTPPSFLSARGTLTPPETTGRTDLAAFSSGLDHPASSSTAMTTAESSTIHPSLEALNRDLIRRDRRGAADEKSREMLRARVQALEGRVRELEAELRKARSGGRV